MKRILLYLILIMVSVTASAQSDSLRRVVVAEDIMVSPIELTQAEQPTDTSSSDEGVITEVWCPGMVPLDAKPLRYNQYQSIWDAVMNMELARFPDRSNGMLRRCF